MTLSQLVRIIWARRRLYCLLLFSFVAFVALVTFVWPKSYVAEASVVVDSKGTDPVTGMVAPLALLPSNIATQVNIISSHTVALKVIDRLKLVDSPEIRERFQSDTGGEGSIRDWLADKILRKLDVIPMRDSNVIGIDFSANDPQLAAAVANAFAEAYIQTSLELQADPARRQANWFDNRVRELRETLETAQQHLSDFQKKQNIVGTDDRLDVEAANLAEISNQLVAAQTAMYDADTRRRQMNQALERNRIDELPDILGNVLLQTMKADVTHSESRLAQIAEHFDRNHPQYLSAAAEVKALRGKLEAEIETAKGSINQAAEIAEHRVLELQKAVDNQKGRILSLKRQHDTLDVLNRQVEGAERTYDAAVSRAGEVRLQGQLDQSSIAVLNPAIAPIRPTWPKVLLNLVLALFVGNILAAGAVLAAENFDRRIRVASDLSETTDLVVLAEVPRFARSGRKRLKNRAPIAVESTLGIEPA